MSNNPRHTRPNLTSIDDVIKYYADLKLNSGEVVHALQVGANDGITDDPIHKYIINHNWKAILVEPQTYVFENQLKETYKNQQNLHFENVAMGREVGELPFYQLSFTKEKWATGLASFVRECLQDHIDRGYVYRKSIKSGTTPPENESDYIEEVMVKVDTFENILSRNNFDRVDLLCIDTEGYDFEVLKMFDFEKFKPELVLFESKNLADEDFINAQGLLKKYGYNLFWQKGNTIAVRFKVPWPIRGMLKAKAFIEKL